MQPTRLRHRAWAMATPLALLLALPAAGAAAPTPGGAGSTSETAAAAAGGTQVTLVTGDRVRLTAQPGGRMAATVEPAARDGHEPVFQTVDDGEHTYLFPSDVVPLLDTTLDRELFNLTRLVEYGYTDGVPVIVMHGDGPRTMAGQAGLANPRPLPSINATAATVDTDGAWWRGAAPAVAGGQASPRPAAGTLAGGSGTKVWLDELAQVALDESASLVGAPQAWDTGFDGTGVTVAVLDTGIDADHPDLAGKVVMAENFTNEADESDRNGHGTHVAGTVAGTGAASDGQYVGVAPGAELLNGKICNVAGTCAASAIIAGMQWAAPHADVVNMSVGTTAASDGTDPMSQAVNALTDAHDTLFVIAAGNEGVFGDATVGSPGAADAALTVGSVDKSEQLAPGSGRGPRLGDFAIKPDITAPGVSIVSARGAGTSTGLPVDDFYRSSSGTSMATPHVAGAAAILLQQDADRSALDLKTALVTTGVPHDQLDVYQQGGGRLDIPAALDTSVYATPTPLNLGYFEYPHADTEPVESQVRYTNRGDEPVTLELSLVATSRDGAVAPEQMLWLESDTVHVDPGQSGTATVVVDPSQGELGLYHGYLVASDGDQVVTRTPVGFHKEPEMYTLTIEGIARDGRAAAGASEVHVVDVHNTGELFETHLFVNGTVAVRVPPGTYHVMGLIYTYDGNDRDVQERTLAGDPELVVSEDITLVLDTREAVLLDIDTPAHERATPGGTSRVAFFRQAAHGSVYASWIGDWSPISATPTEPVSIGGFEFNTRVRIAEPRVALSVTEPVAHPLAVLEMINSPSPDDDLSLPLVFAGLGGPADYDGLDAEGAVVLTQQGGPGWPAKERLAREHGAAALVVANDTTGNFTGMVGGDAEIPTMSLSGEQGELLQGMLDDGEVTVNLYGVSASPYLYDLVHVEPDRIPDPLEYLADLDELATVDNAVHSPVPDQLMTETRQFWRPYEFFSLNFTSNYWAPHHRQEYLVAGDTVYRQTFDAARPFQGTIDGTLTRYESGEHREQSWFKSPLRPGVLELGMEDESFPIYRDGDTLDLLLTEWVDSHRGHRGWLSGQIDTSAFRLYQDGQLIAQAARPQGEYTLAPDPAEYRLELDVAREAPWWTTSTQTHTAWTIQSARPAGADPELVPLLQLDFDVDLDLTNTATETSLSSFDLLVRHQPGYEGARINRAQVSVSYDDGQTWRQRPALPRGDGQFTVMLVASAPAGAEFISIRVDAADSDGNRIEQEVMRAWQLP